LRQRSRWVREHAGRQTVNAPRHLFLRANELCATLRNRLVEAALAGYFLDELPERLIGDKAYGSDTLDEHLPEEYGFKMISPNRSNRKQKTQDAPCAATSADERSNGSLRGCKTTAGWSRDGSTASKTNSALFNSHACSCCIDIYETALGKPCSQRLPAGLVLNCRCGWNSGVPGSSAPSHGCALVASACESTTAEFGAASSKYFTKC